MPWYAWALAAAGGYVAFCYWFVFDRGEFREVYWAPIGKLLRAIGMQAITLGPTCCMYQPWAKLSPRGRRHERWHYEEQQRRHPLIFWPRYLILLIIHGHQNHPDEIAARAAEG